MLYFQFSFIFLYFLIILLFVEFLGLIKIKKVVHHLKKRRLRREVEMLTKFMTQAMSFIKLGLLEEWL